MDTSTRIITQVKTWIEKTVIGYRFCPFASLPYAMDQVKYVMQESIEIEVLLEELILACKELVSNSSIETTLLIYPDQLSEFGEFLDFLNLAEGLLELQGYEGIFQIASFHPLYRFADTEKKDAANYTNRSPYPILQLLRETSLDEQLAKHPDPESIPEANIQRAREAGEKAFQKILKDIEDLGV